jgi:hypothetical protein
MVALAAGVLAFMLVGWTVGTVRAVLSIPGVALVVMLALLVFIRFGRHWL